jgi:hypothetical protein
VIKWRPSLLTALSLLAHLFLIDDRACNAAPPHRHAVVPFKRIKEMGTSAGRACLR